MLYQLN